jgi:hypothetical protein
MKGKPDDTPPLTPNLKGDMPIIAHSTNGATPVPTNVSPSTAPILDLNQFRLSQDFAGSAGVTKLLNVIPVQKPKRQDFVRVHPSPAYQEAVSLLEVQEDREYYLVGPDALSACANEVIPVMLRLAITRRNNPFIWPLRLPAADGRDNAWHASAREAAALAQERWVSVRANQDIGGYDVMLATAAIQEPTWPDKSFAELLAIAFKGRIILDPFHEVLLRLAGSK